MANTIENRVVEMRFDNQQFESNVKQSLTTLEKLEQALNMKGSAKGLEEINKASREVTLESLQDSIDAVNKRFSALNIIGTTALVDLTRTAISAGKKIYDATLGQIKSGGMTRALNIEQAKFQLKGLGVAWEEVSDDIDYAVSGTAYGLDVAAKAASQLVASGVTLGDEMKKALRGISGVAAMANSSYEEISPIFTTVAGQGKLMTMQLRQLESRGLNVAATMAKFFNDVKDRPEEFTDSVVASVNNLSRGLEVSEQDIRDFVTKGSIDFQLFSNAMDSAFGEHAKDANTTFTGALSNMKAALSRIGAEFATPYMDNMIPVFNELRLIINNVKTDLKSMIEASSNGMRILSNWFVKTFDSKKFMSGWREAGGPVALTNTLVNLVTALYSYIVPVKRAFADLIPGNVGTGIANFVKILERLSRHLILSKNASDNLTKVLKVLVSPLRLIFTIIKGIVSAIGPISNVILAVFGKIGQFASNIKAVAVNLGIFEKIGTGLKIVLGAIILGVLKLVQAISQLANFIKNSKIFEYSYTGLNKVLDILKALAGGAILGVISGVKALVNLINKIKTPGFFENVDIFEKVGSALLKLKSMIVNFFKSLTGNKSEAEEFVKATTVVVESTERLSSGMEITVGTIERASKKIETPFQKISSLLKKFAIYILDAFKNLSKVKEKYFPNLTAGTLIVYGFALSLIRLMQVTSRVLPRLTNGLNIFSSIFAPLKKGLTELGKAEKYKSIGILIGSIAVSLFILAKVPGTDLLKSAGYIIVVSAALLTLLGVFSRYTELKTNGLKGINDVVSSINIIGFSAFVISLAAFAKILSTIPEGFVINIWGFLEIIGALIAVAAALRIAKFDPGSGLGVLLLVGALALLIPTLKKFGEDDFSGLKKKIENNTKYVIALGIFAGVLVSVFLYSKKLGGTSGFNSVGINLLALAVAVKILAKVAHTIGTTDFSGLKSKIENNKKLVVALGLFGLALVSVLAFAKGTFKQIGISIIALGATVALIANAVKKWGELNKNELGRALTAAKELTKFVGILVGVLLVIPKAQGAAKTIAMMTIAIGAVAMSLLLLAKLANWYELIAPTLALGTVIFALAQSLRYAARFTKNTKGIKAFAIVIVELALALGGIALLASMPIKNILASAISIGLVFAALSGTLYIASKMTKTVKLDAIKELTGSIALIAGGLTLLAAVGGAAGGWKSIAAAGVSMSLVLISLGGSFKLIQTMTRAVKLEPIKEMMKAVGVIAAGLTVLAAVGGAAGGWQSVISAGAALSLTLIAMAAGMKIASASSGDINKDALIEMGLAALALSGMLVGLTLLSDPDALVAAAEALSLSLISLGGAMILSGFAKGDIDISSVVSMIPGIFALGVALAAVSQLADPNVLSQTAQSLALCLISLGGAVAIADLSEGGNVWPTILAMAVATLAIGHALAEIATVVDPSSIYAAAVGVSGAIVSLAVAAKIAEGSETGALALAVLAVGVTAMAFGLGYLAQIPWQQILVGAIAVIAITAALTGLGYIASKFPDIAIGAAAIAVAMIELGFGMLLAGAGVAMAVGSIALLIQALVLLGNMSEEAAERVGTNLVKMAEGIVKAFTKAGSDGIKALIGGLVNGAKKVIETAFKLGESLIKGFAEAVGWHSPWEEFEEACVDGIRALQEGLDEKFGFKIGLDLGEAVEKGLNGLKDIMGDLGIDSGLSLGDGMFEGLYDSGIMSFMSNLRPLTKAEAELQNWNAEMSGAKANQIQYKKGMDDMMPSMDELNEKLKDLGGGTKGAGSAAKEAKKEIGPLFNIIKDGGPVVEVFYDKYRKTMSELDDTTALTVATQSVEKLALSLYESTLKAMTSEELAEEMSKSSEERLASLKKSYDDFRKSLKETIEGQIDIFKEFDKKTELSKKTLLKNMQSQIDGVREWAGNLANLVGRGLDAGLYSKLKDMGPQGYEYVHAFMTMTDEELKKASDLYTESLTISDKATNTIMAGMAYAGTMTANGFSDGVLSSTGISDEAMIFLAQSALAAFQDEMGIQSPSRVMIEQGNYMIQGLRKGLEDNLTILLFRVMVLCQKVYNKFHEELAESKFWWIGYWIDMGIARGITENESIITDAAREAAKAAYEAAMDELEINSPSHVFQRIGNYICQGMALGIEDQTKDVEAASRNMAESTYNIVDDSMYQLSEIVRDNMELNPVIRPTLDISDVVSQASILTSLFDAARDSTLSVGSGLDADGMPIGTNGVTFVQNNYSPKALSRLDIYRNTRNQISMLKGFAAK